jgi:creatinine amidohydrolase
VLPTLWAGIAEHHIPFGGTIALDYTTFAGFIRQVARSISAAGFQRLFIVNGHGGNTYPLQIAIKDITHETGVRLGASSYWLLAKQAFRDTLEDQVSVMHACEAETSMMLLIEGELVRRDQLAHAHGGRQVTHTPGEGTPVMRFTSYAERSNTGVRGDARRATAEKGAKLFDAVVAAVAQVIADARHWPAPDPVWRSGRALDPRSPI